MIRHAQITEPSGPVTVTDAPEPVLSDKESLVRLVAAELAPLDLQIARGEVPSARFPLRPGSSAVAEVVASDWFEPGARVFIPGGAVGMGRTAPGVLAERFAVPDRILTPVPDGLEPARAAAGVISVVTALLALDEAGLEEEGGWVLILGASGSVGSAAAVLAERAGARVLAAVRRPGDYTGPGTPVPFDQLRESVAEATAGQGVDVIVDLVAGPYLDAAVLCGGKRARHLLVGYTAGRSTSFTVPLTMINQHRLLGFNLWQAAAGREREAVAEALDLLAKEVVVPEVAGCRPISQVGAAYQQAAEAKGRIVITGEDT